MGALRGCGELGFPGVAPTYDEVTPCKLCGEFSFKILLGTDGKRRDNGFCIRLRR